MRTISRDEATTVERPEGKPWVWPDVAYTMISDTHNVAPELSLYRAANGDPLILAYAVRMLECLYDAGYVVVDERDQG